ncbi:MAG: bacterial extracellular solute-binding protein [Lachnospiraceae bacterium]|nr:bacterial extracellular solute-binding protein [Lachnospiraceae bacterium]
MKKSLLTVVLLGLITLTGCSTKPAENQVQTSEQTEASQVQTSEQEQENLVNIYSSRNYDVDKDIFLHFEEETGIKVNLIEGKGDELIERMNREKNNPQADLFLTVGGETISYAKEEGLLQSHGIENLNTTIEEGFYGEDWIALTKRARVLVFDKNDNSDFQIQSYLDLGQDKYKDSLLVRSGTSSYNIALTANIIQNYGSEKAREFVSGVVNNLAREPQGNDRDQAKGVIAGDGEFAIMNTYYISKMITSADQAEVEVGQQVGAAFPEETHVNISWGGIIKDSKNKENAQKLLEYLLVAEQQEMYMEKNGEYPINNNVELNEFLKGLGEFKQMPVNYETLGNHTTEAIMLMDELGWK